LVIPHRVREIRLSSLRVLSCYIREAGNVCFAVYQVHEDGCEACIIPSTVRSVSGTFFPCYVHFCCDKRQVSKCHLAGEAPAVRRATLIFLLLSLITVPRGFFSPFLMFVSLNPTSLALSYSPFRSRQLHGPQVNPVFLHRKCKGVVTISIICQALFSCVADASAADD
jgi:hypothetical protein